MGKQDASRLSKQRHEKYYAKKLARRTLERMKNMKPGKATTLISFPQLKRVCQALLKFG